MDKSSQIYKVRHSAAHLLGQAVTELYPNVQLTLGPATDTGFFYDFFMIERLKETDLVTIETKMREIAARKLPITGKQISRKEALALYKNNKFKTEILNGIKDDTVSIYSQGDFSDLCEGGHVANTGELKYFRLTGLAGSYWRADKEREQLQRVSGVAFQTQADLDAYNKMVEDAIKYDHRALGKQLDLYSFHDEAAGMPFFHNKGLIIFNTLMAHARKLQAEAGYTEILTPLILREELWKTSGHYENYKDNMYFARVTKEDVPLGVKPMNCPGGILMYQEKPHSYRELPLRVAEFGKVHRFELSGVLHGLFRVRAFTQDDAHIYCTPAQAADEVVKVLEFAEKLYAPFNFSNVRFAISTMPAKRIGSDELWHEATEMLKTALNKRNTPFTINEGEGAFYGPKIEILLSDNMGREWQCGTVQVDFFLPQNFKLEYIDADQSRKTPVMLHRAIYGSLERFMGILVEHYKGRFPFWLSPIQARVLPISDKQSAYADSLATTLKQAGIRAEIDRSGDKISAQIRRAQMEEIPWMLVVGAKEQEANTATLRLRDGSQQEGLHINELLEKAKTESNN